MNQYFPKPYEPFGGGINAKLTYPTIQRRLTSRIYHILILVLLD